MNGIVPWAHNCCSVKEIDGGRICSSPWVRLPIPGEGHGVCSEAISHSLFWLSAFGTLGPPLRGRGKIGPLGLLVGVFPTGVFPSHRIKDG
jgi:hypothetical protein